MGDLLHPQLRPGGWGGLGVLPAGRVRIKRVGLGDGGNRMGVEGERFGLVSQTDRNFSFFLDFGKIYEE